MYIHDDVMKWKHFPCYWPFMRGIHRSPMTWSFDICFDLHLIKRLANNQDAGDLRRHYAHYGVTVMFNIDSKSIPNSRNIVSSIVISIQFQIVYSYPFTAILKSIVQIVNKILFGLSESKGCKNIAKYIKIHLIRPLAKICEYVRMHVRDVRGIVHTVLLFVVCCYTIGVKIIPGIRHSHCVRIPWRWN